MCVCSSQSAGVEFLVVVPTHWLDKADSNENEGVDYWDGSDDENADKAEDGLNGLNPLLKPIAWLQEDLPHTTLTPPRPEDYDKFLLSQARKPRVRGFVLSNDSFREEIERAGAPTGAHEVPLGVWLNKTGKITYEISGEGGFRPNPAHPLVQELQGAAGSGTSWTADVGAGTHLSHLPNQIG